MTYKDKLTEVMGEVAKIDNVIFLGYNTRYGHRFNGTLSYVQPEKCLEMPVAENLIMGVAMGMALEGYRPVICLERMDFLWACADALVNHLDKAEKLGWPPLKVIIRTCVGYNKPLDCGCQHLGNYTEIMKLLLKEIRVIDCKTKQDIRDAWKLDYTGSVMIIEHRELYESKL